MMEETEKNRIENGTLYLVATPIGNLSDVSERAVKVLGEVDMVAAEDSRVTAKLLAGLGLHPSVVSYHEHNKREMGPQLVEKLKNGASCALVTDAGTPAVSDPGADLVTLCIEAGIPVTAVPGACAAITALILSGLNTRRFAFEGFLDGTEKEKAEHLREICRETRTLIFYEAPHRLIPTLKLMREILGDRRIALCRELTKRNEEIRRVTLAEAVRLYETLTPRGEYVLVVEGFCRETECFWENMTVPEHVAYYMEHLGMDKMTASKAAARDRGVSKSVIYKELL